MENPFREELPVFGGRFRLITEHNEFRMSHWVKGFGLVDSLNGNFILELETSFNLSKFEEHDGALKVYFEIFPDGSVQYESEIDPYKLTFSCKGQLYNLKDFSRTFKEFRSH
ncbi:MAG: hypothetical protein KDC13_08195 [Bacteroidetes bacterium]|nr:hypothetical protein [Bacteroidota bacterium]